MTVERVPINPLVKHLHQTPPPVLYHYTSMEVLERITSAGAVWASDIDFLNDSSEYVNAKAFIKEELEKRTVHDDVLKDLVSSQVGQMYHELDHPDVFVTSFSKDGDSLPQWRGYCPTGLGVAIGFNPWALKVGELGLSPVAVLSSKEDPIAMNLLQCVYTEKQKLTLIGAHIENYLRKARREAPSRDPFGSGMLLRALTDFCCPLFKDESFQEEREWRLTVISHCKDIPDRHFRIGRSTLVPFIKIDVKTNYRLDFIKEVVIGPAPNRNLAYMGVKRLLNSRELSRAKVRNSNIPYRMW
jgi:hypothetical protein